MASRNRRREIGRPVYLTNLVRDDHTSRHAKKPTDTKWYVSGPGSWGARYGDRNFERLNELSAEREIIVHGNFYNPQTNQWRISRGRPFVGGDESASGFAAWRENYEDDGYELVEMMYTYL